MAMKSSTYTFIFVCPPLPLFLSSSHSMYLGRHSFWALSTGGSGVLLADSPVVVAGWSSRLTSNSLLAKATSPGPCWMKT